jgi:hypothetical protein
MQNLRIATGMGGLAVVMSILLAAQFLPTLSTIS